MHLRRFTYLAGHEETQVAFIRAHDPGGDNRSFFLWQSRDEGKENDLPL